MSLVLSGPPCDGCIGLRWAGIDPETCSSTQAERMTSRFEKVEHTINNSASKTVQAVKEAVRDMLSPRRPGE